MPDILPFANITADAADLVGGKGLSLGLLAAAGFPVPPGFCITTEAYRNALADGLRLDEALGKAVEAAYTALGGGPVAVRSSATAEDGAVTSFAGQQETILGVEGVAALREAVERCWRSLHTERARAYRDKQRVAEAGLAMAVVVQRLVPAEAAGVLFTRDPLDTAGEHMLVEASWGLGEAVVSGRVQPDRFALDRQTGAVRDRQLGRKSIRIDASGESMVPPGDQQRFCVSDERLAELGQLGRRVEAFYGDARDVEWAVEGDRVWLLQARPITAASASEREQVRRQEITKLRAIADPHGTVWVRYNLVEILPEPTPMTWAVVQRLLSGKGGAGGMYRDLGFDPDPALDDLSVYDLVGGRPYCNLSREPRLQSRRPFFGYPLAHYKTEPHQALTPEPDTGRILGGPLRRLRWPVAIWHMVGTASRIHRQARFFADEFTERIVPAFSTALELAFTEDLGSLDSPALVGRFESWVERTLVDFARHSQKPTLFADFSLKVLEQQLRSSLGPERTRAALTELSGFARPSREADYASAIRDLAEGRLDRRLFLVRFGHRAAREMELAHPRWSEEPDAAPRPEGGAAPADTPASSERPASLAEACERIAAEARLNSFVAGSVRHNAERLCLYLGLRETAKHYLMRGYAEIRRSLVELGWRHGLGDGIFYLTPGELPDLAAGKDFSETVAERRKYRTLALSLEVPPVLFSDDLEAIGRPLPAAPGVSEREGVPLSSGVVEGPALVLAEPPREMPATPGYILVCPSTDPSWVPLFVHARGLVMESGGILSHGAIVAREFGLPAVAGLPGVHETLRTGQRLRVDGSRGTVTVLSEWPGSTVISPSPLAGEQAAQRRRGNEGRGGG